MMTELLDLTYIFTQRLCFKHFLFFYLFFNKYLLRSFYVLSKNLFSHGIYILGCMKDTVNEYRNMFR